MPLATPVKNPCSFGLLALLESWLILYLTMDEPGTLRSALNATTLAAGFDLCRVLTAEPPRHAENFRDWLTRNRHGSMDWLVRNAERRTNPELVLPGVSSIIVLGLNYWQTAPEHAQTDRAIGRIARYAWGDDYHEIIERKLETVAVWLQQQGGTQRSYVDTGPVLERDFAAMAGVGWQGKSTMLIHPKFGPWLFLAAILTTLPFEPDKPMQDHCGKCTRCMTACPTGAIDAPYQLDARRCISFLTIENKGAIPEEFRPLIGDRIYGCDECLDVCPWNRFAKEGRETALQAREYVTWKMRDFLALDDAGFRTLFKNSPIKRVKRRGFLRNVCVALGNTGTAEDIPALEKAATDVEPLIAEHAQWALHRIRKGGLSGG